MTHIIYPILAVLIWSIACMLAMAFNAGASDRRKWRGEQN